VLAWLGCTLGGSAHAFAIRKRVLAGHSARPDDALRQAKTAAEQRRKLRDEARALAARDPALARELGIGRPDRSRDYDDGGLVDVNHCPASVLMTLPGITPALAARVVELRQDRGAFVSADELSDALGLPPGDVSYLADKTIYPA
jgi:DNA uptake protein ComE-like DNA-binding protein